MNKSSLSKLVTGKNKEKPMQANHELINEILNEQEPYGSFGEIIFYDMYLEGFSNG